MSARVRRRELLAAGAAAALAPGASFAAEPVVRTSGGEVRGVAADGVSYFRGIPCGAPPVGLQRFRPPSPAAPWTGVRDATAWGHRAPQLSQAGQIAREMVGNREQLRRTEPEGEDCLVLNVYTPASSGRRPVMVWLHGGGYASGSGGPSYDAQELARRQDVVVVTVNHRLNVLGFLDLSHLGPRYAQSGNVGMLDIVLALKWVQANIAAFGGNPGNVTVFGHSGGGAKVSVLMAMPQARGLFHKAIAQSGAVTTALSRAEAAELTTALLAELKIERGDIARLQAIPADDLLAAMGRIGATGNPASTRNNFGPVIDGAVLPAAPFAAGARSPSADVPLMVGWTLEETRSFWLNNPGFDTMTPADVRVSYAKVARIPAAEADRIVSRLERLQPGLTPPKAYIEVTTQTMFGRPSWGVAEARAAARAPTFLYRIDWTRPGPEGARLGAAHGIETRLLFGLPPNDEPPETRRMRETFMAAWGSFARTGQPAAPSLPAWPPYAPAARPTMIFNDATRLGAEPSPELAAWARTLPDFHP